MILLKREIDQIAKDKGIDRKVIVGAVEEAIDSDIVALAGPPLVIT